MNVLCFSLKSFVKHFLNFKMLTLLLLLCNTSTVLKYADGKPLAVSSQRLEARLLSCWSAASLLAQLNVSQPQPALGAPVRVGSGLHRTFAGMTSSTGSESRLKGSCSADR